MIYLDNAATGLPKNEKIFPAIREALLNGGNAGRGGHVYAVYGANVIYSCRKNLAALFNAEPENVILTKNATEALNIAIKGVFDGKNGILISSLEHNAVFRPVHALCKKAGAAYKIFDVDLYDDEKTVKNFISCINKNISLAVFTHASNVCGKLLPVNRLIAEAKKRGLVTVLDAAQTAGCIKIDINRLGADIICVPGHKGLGGPMGTGAMIINKSFKPPLSVFTEGGTGINSLEEDMPSVVPERFEAGTLNVPGFAGLAAACGDFVYPEGTEKIFEKLVGGLRARNDVILYGAPEHGIKDRVPIVLFNIKNKDSETAAGELDKKGIAVRSGFHCSPLAHKALGTISAGAVRASLGPANTAGEIDCFLNAL